MSEVMLTAKQALRTVSRKMLKELQQTPAAQAAQSADIAARVVAHPLFGSAQRVAVYLAMPDEVATAQIIDHIFASGKQCYVPRFTADDMDMWSVSSADDIASLPRAKWDIQQPEDTALRTNPLAPAPAPAVNTAAVAHTVAPAPAPQAPPLRSGTDTGTDGTLASGGCPGHGHRVGIDLIIVPGLGFSSAGGHRLGRGKGYYDRYMAKCKRVMAHSGMPPPATLGIAFAEQRFGAVPFDEFDIKIDDVIFGQSADCAVTPLAPAPSDSPSAIDKA